MAQRPINRKPGKHPGRKSAAGDSLSGGGERPLTVNVKTAKGRKTSSTRWLQRQLNDPYVVAAKRDGYRSRAAYKLLEIDDRFHLLKKGARVIDLGSAPGGWSQVCAARVGAKGAVVAIDKDPVEAIPGVTFAQIDFLDPGAPDVIKTLAGGAVDIVLSDMAAGSTGHRQTDHIKIMALCESALAFACEVLSPGGHFAAKVLKGGTENELLSMMQTHFGTVRHAKPKASRQDSAEAYVVALNFRGS
ncbi:MAG: RlmE family RNA methyltransferase [Proteobacteria bacterium]|jgi:23S rRNA (uridine2552-2'-O)-methyltransferase|nr:RlmE family RNA methyltransferase [Pseudomonadota bacterium]